MLEIIETARRRQRITVLVGLVVGLCGGLLSLWAESVHGAVGLLTLLPPVAFLGLSIRELARRPGTAELQVDESARAVFSPPHPTLSYLPILCGWFAFIGVNSASRAGDDPLRWLLIPVFAVVCVALAAVYWRRVPFVTLTAEGVSSGAPNPVAVVPWAALGAGAPVGPGAAGRYLRLPVAHPELIRRTGWGSRRGAFVPVRELAVSPGFLSAAIQYYVAHPEHRPVIGTAAEHARLRHALTGAPLTGQV
ncbi:hypothetical protein [Micromonospora sp. NPDC005806]|uniref:hypothetical protein n=1 Tax=Micromonospora sp. NPDC005806 TaxID=3364234 RepID=UPI003685CEF6